VPNPGKDETGDAALKRLEEGDFPVLKSQHGISFPKLHPVLGGNRVDVLRIDRQGIESGEKFARRRIRCVANGREKKPKNHQEESKPHEKSVDTFGMREQGGRRSFPRRVKMSGCRV
jgi:hypothetical protein